MLLVLDDFLQHHLVEFTIHNQSFKKICEFSGECAQNPYMEVI